jgi:glc operon protein GlcG
MPSARNLVSMILAAVAAAVIGITPADAQSAAVSYETARLAAEAAEAEAVRNGWNVTIVVVDQSGAPVYVKRMDGAAPRTFDFAFGKARTAAISGLTTADYARAVAAGTVEAVPDAVSIEGGLPILLDGQVVGAIAVSGLPPRQDAEVAQVGLEAIDG